MAAWGEWSPDNGVIGETTAGADGRFVLPKEVRFHHPDAIHEPAALTLVADAPGLAPAWVVLSPDDAPDADRVLTLTPPTRQGFEVVDRAGQPVPGAVVWLDGAGRPDDRRASFRQRLFLPADLGVCRGVTGAAGKVSLENLPDTLINLTTTKEGFGDYAFHMSQRVGPDQRIILQRASVLEGRVTDPLGRPVAGATVSLSPKFRYHHFFEAKTDAQGRYRVERIWSDREAHPDQPDWGRYDVAVRHRRFTAATREVAFATGQTITGFDLAAVPGTELVGRLLDPETKAPVVSGAVQVDSPSGRQTFRTDVNGAFRGRVMPGKIYAFFYLTPRGRYVDAQGSSSGLRSNLEMEAYGEQVALDLYLPSPLGRIGVVRGLVSAADGKPAPGCRVAAVIGAGHLQIGRWSGNQPRGATTDAEGRFTLPEVPIGPGFTLTARAADGSATGTLAGKLEGDVLDLTEPLILQPTVAGGEFLLTDLAGKPRPNLAVYVSPVVAGEELRGQRQELKTDAAGVLRVTRVIPGTRHVVAIPDVYVDRRANVFDAPAAGAPAAPRRPLVLDEQALVRLLGADGQPLPVKNIRRYEASTTLHGQPTRWSNAVPVVGRAGADAVVTRRDMVSKRGASVRLLLETDDGTLVRAEGTLPEDGSNTLQLRATATIQSDTAPDPAIADVDADAMAGRVVTPGGEPIVGAVVEFPGAHWRESQPPIVSGPDGVFRLPGLGRQAFINYATVAREGWATAFLTNVPVGKGFRVTLRKDSRLRGTVAGGGEQAPGPVGLLLKKNKPTNRPDAVGDDVRDLALRLTTDERGAYDFPVEPGLWRWEASGADGRFARGEVNLEPGKVVDPGIALRRGHDLIFELVDCQGGQPVPGIEVSIYEQRPDRVFAPRPGSAKTSDAAGSIRWENLPPGDKQFHSPRMQGGYPMPGHAQHPYARWWREDEPVGWRRVNYAKQAPTGDRGAQPIYVDVKDGQPTVRVLLERGVKVAGRVVGPDGAGLAALNVQAVAQPSGGVSNFRAQTDREGNFLAYLPAGNGVAYTLNAYLWPENENGPGANAVSARFSSKPGDEFTFNLAMTPGGWFTGRLVTAEGHPAAGFKVTARATDGLDSAYAARIATADSEGRFRLGPLRPGKYEVHAGTGRGAPLRELEGDKKHAGEIPADGDSRDLGNLSLPPGAKLRE